MGTKKGKNILDRLDAVELEMLKKDTEYAKQFLAEEGVNVSEEENFATNYIKKICFMAMAKSNMQKDKALMQAALDKLKETIKENAQKASDVLIQLLHNKTPSVQYRKLENWTDEEIRDVLGDVDLVKLMEELDKQGY